MTEHQRHYDEAEQLLSIVDEGAAVSDTMLSREQLIGAAHAHATLAVADRLDQMIDAWRTRVDSVPTPTLVDVATATAIIRRAGKVRGR